ncbi:ALF repeat-containing protein, partial [Amycolatopsis alba]
MRTSWTARAGRRRAAARLLAGTLALALTAGLVGASPASADPTVPDGAAATDRERVLAAWKDGGPAVQIAAGAALTGTEAQLKAFLDAGQATAELEDVRAQVEQLASGGGPVVRERAKAALAGSQQVVQTYLVSGWIDAHLQDL